MATPIFAVNDACVALHKGSPFDAKIIEIKEHAGVLKYKIHFSGWNARYDERIKVGEEEGKLFKGTVNEYLAARGMPISDETSTPASKSKKKGKGAAAAATASPAVTESTPKTAPKSASKASSSKAKPKEQTPTTSKIPRIAIPNPLANLPAEPEYQIELTPSLKKILVDDHDLVARGFLSKVPARFSVDAIISDYVKTIPITREQLNQDLNIEYDGGQSIHASNVAVVLTSRGIVDYFNVVLGFQLLYQFERIQYNELLQKKLGPKGVKAAISGTALETGFRASAEYGLIHLLRMVARMPELLALTDWDNFLKQRIVAAVVDFVVFLNKHYKKYYHEADDYESATLPYYRRANHGVADEQQQADDQQPSTSSRR